MLVSTEDYGCENSCHKRSTHSDIDVNDVSVSLDSKVGRHPFPPAQEKSLNQTIADELVVVRQYQVDVEISPGTNYEKKQGYSKFTSHQY